jgi:hypothetical protein
MPSSPPPRCPIANGERVRWFEMLLLALALGLCACVPPAFEGDDPGECNDSADNDADGLYDCSDPDCARAPVCTPPIGECVPTIDPMSPPLGRFESMTESAGLLEQDRVDGALGGNGVAVGDINGDGLDDLFLLGNKMMERVVQNRMYVNLGEGLFSEEAADRGLPLGSDINLAGPSNIDMAAAFADFDNDGDQDLFVAGDNPNKLLRNDDGQFTDVSVSSGISGPDVISVGLALGDYDQDGFIDLLVVNHQGRDKPPGRTGRNGPRGDDGGEGGDPGDHGDPGGGGLGGEPDSLFHNNGDGTFTDVSEFLPEPLNPGVGFAASWVDVDHDGDPDLYVVNDEGQLAQPNQLYRNDGPDGSGGWLFTRISDDCGCDLAIFGMGTAIGDYDRDGDQDLYVTNLADGGGEVLLQSQGDGTYVDVTLAASARTGNNSDRTTSWGTEFIDIDNDGWLDLFTAFGSLMLPYDPDSLVAAPNVMLRNEGGTFSVVEDSGVEGSPATSEGAAAVDYDLDGCMDLIVQNLDGQPALYHNRCEGPGSWIGFRLEGTRSNRDAIGAEVRIRSSGGSQVAQVFGGSTSVHSGRTKKIHFGLGSATSIQQVQVSWPSGCVEEFSPPPPGCYHDLLEGSGASDNGNCGP